MNRARNHNHHETEPTRYENHDGSALNINDAKNQSHCSLKQGILVSSLAGYLELNRARRTVFKPKVVVSYAARVRRHTERVIS